MENNVIVRISLEYALFQLDEDVLDRIIQKELTRDEKANLIASLHSQRAKIILMKIGFTPEFLKTIE
jgi:hypothetical protein